MGVVGLLLAVSVLFSRLPISPAGFAAIAFALAAGLALFGGRLLCWATGIEKDTIAGCMLQPAARMLAGFVALAAVAIARGTPIETLCGPPAALPLIVLATYLLLLVADVVRASHGSQNHPAV